MYKLRIFTLFMLLGGVLSSAKTAAQDSIRSLADFEYIKGKEGWFTSNNAAGLHALPVENVSIAEVYFNKGNGKFVNYFESANSCKYGGKAESYFRMNPRIVLYGYVEYNKFAGKEMSGSVFIDPYYMPFDIVEMDDRSLNQYQDDKNRGKKELEQYHLVGAVSAEVYSGLRLGGKIDYLAGNYAKLKDLRHRNTLMDMSLTLGASYQIHPAVEVGANYFYRRSTEGLTLKMFGNTDQQYYSLISFGSFYGRSELFGNSGYTAGLSSGSKSAPVFNKFNGGSLQINLNLSSSLTLFNEFTYKSQNGYYGLTSSTHTQFTRHDGNLMEYNGVFSLKTNNNLHSLRLIVGQDELDNYEKVYKDVTTSAGNTIIEYYGETLMLNRKNTDAGLQYTGNIGLKSNYPSWVLKAGANYRNREQTVSVYPYFRKQTIRSLATDISAKRNIFSGKNIYSISLGAGYGTGSGTPLNDGLYATPSSSQKEPSSSELYLYREYEYLTASRIGINAGFRFETPVSEEVNAYTGFDCSYTKAMNIEYLRGNSFTSATIKIGCSF